MFALNLSVELEALGPCWKCGITYAAPAHFVQIRREDQAEFFCPNGHSAVFKESENVRLRRQLDEERKKREWAEAARNLAQKTRDTAERGRAVAAGKLKALRGRIKNGVCPCCNRSFENLQRHIKTKHPEFSDMTEADAHS